METKEKRKYCVPIARTGCVFVIAETEEDAIDIANHQVTSTISWSDDWEATDCYEDDTIPDCMCVTEKAFD